MKRSRFYHQIYPIMPNILTHHGCLTHESCFFVTFGYTLVMFPPKRVEFPVTPSFCWGLHRHSLVLQRFSDLCAECAWLYDGRQWQGWWTQVPIDTMDGCTWNSIYIHVYSIYVYLYIYIITYIIYILLWIYIHICICCLYAYI